MKIARRGGAPQRRARFRLVDNKKIVDWTLPYEKNERESFAVHRGQ